MARHVQAEGAETINGVKTFGSFPITPSSAPTTDYEVANKKYVDDNIILTKPYKVYTALLAQSGTDAPIATVLENTLDGLPVWTRTSTGLYKVTLTGKFTLGKTLVFINNFLILIQWNGNFIEVSCLGSGDVPSDNLLLYTSFEIRVYP